MLTNTGSHGVIICVLIFQSAFSYLSSNTLFFPSQTAAQTRVDKRYYQLTMQEQQQSTHFVLKKHVALL